MNLEPGNPGDHLFDQRVATIGVAFAQHADVDRQAFERAQHLADVPGPRGHCGAIGAVSRADAAAKEGGHTVGQRVISLLRRDQVNVGVDPGSGQNQVFAGDGVGAHTHHQARGYAIHGARVTAFTNPGNLAVADADVGFDHALDRVDDGDVGDHQVQYAVIAGQGVVGAHAVTQGFTAAVYGLVAVTA